MLTQRADRLMPYDVLDMWRRHESAALHEDEPKHHLEELALMTVARQVADTLAADLRAPRDLQALLPPRSPKRPK